MRRQITRTWLAEQEDWMMPWLETVAMMHKMSVPDVIQAIDEGRVFETDGETDIIP